MPRQIFPVLDAMDALAPIRVMPLPSKNVEPDALANVAAQIFPATPSPPATVSAPVRLEVEPVAFEMAVIPVNVFAPKVAMDAHAPDTYT